MLFCFLSIDMFVFFTRYSLRYLSLKLDISSIKLLLLYKVFLMAFAFAQKLSARLSKADKDKGYRSLREAI